MKIVFITPFPNQDTIHEKETGVGSYSYMLVNALSKITSIEIWAQKSEKLSEYTVGDITVKRVWTRNLSGIIQIIKNYIFNRPDIVHIQHEFNIFGGIPTVFFSPVIVIIARLLCIRVITTMHGGFGLAHIDKKFIVANGSNLPPFFIKLGFLYVFGVFAHFSHHVIVHEPWQKNELENEYSVYPKKITVIAHGVPETVEHILDARKQLELLDGVPVYLYMGFASPYKGLKELLDAYKDFIQSRNAPAYLIIGAGTAPRLEQDKQYMSWYEDLKKQYQELGDFVRWVGFIPSAEIPLYYSACETVVFPYTQRLAASGPMAIAIGYEKDILLSSILKGEKEYSFDFTHPIATSQLKNERSWDLIAKKTFSIY